MNLQYITPKDRLYEEAIKIRIDSFFKGIPNSFELINDSDEIDSFHIVYLKNNTVQGTGRLTLKTDNKTIISQMAIHHNYRNQGIGSEILKSLIEKSKKLKVSKIELSARETAIEFYKKHGFKTLGGFYPSKKTGIIHQKMHFFIKTASL